MADEVNYAYDAKFKENILVVGRTGCGKTTFVQNLQKNHIFGKLKEVIWVWKISFSRDREFNVWDCFVNENFSFQYPNNIEKIDDLLEHFQRQKSPCIENCLGENVKLDRLIVMDNASGLADHSDNFANFLTVSRKCRITYVYIFHTIYPTRQNWQMILSQTKMFNIFPG